MTIYSLEVLLSQLEPVCCSISSSNCCFLTSYRFHRREIRWSGILISLKIFHSLLLSTVKDFCIVNEAEVDIFLKFHRFFYDPTNVGNLISGSSDFSKPSLYIWKFSVHVLLKPSLKDSEHNLTSMWNERNCRIVWASFDIGMKTDLFQSCGHCWAFQICWHIECSTLTASSFTILSKEFSRQDYWSG